MVEERLAKMDEYGEDWDDKPVCQTILLSVVLILSPDPQNDMLMWLMSEAKGVERSIEGLARRLFVINLAAIHSTSLVRRAVLPSSIVQSNHCIPIDAHASIVPSSCPS
jgi:hypothetical protein